jgi:biopolymer transport protein ExbD
MKFYVRRRTSPVITIVSLIDILTIILIFFIVTTQFKNEEMPLTSKIKIVLPESKQSVNTPNTALPAVLAVKPSGDLFFDGRPITLPELGDAVKQAQDVKRPLALAADEKAAFGRIVEVLDTLQLAGVKNLPAFTREKNK